MEVRKDRLRFFRSGKELGRWLEKNHEQSEELWIGLYTKSSGKGGITYGEALDEALCYGWIDGIRKKLDSDSFAIRFTSRKPRSIWSKVNLGHVARLTREGRMKPAGIAAFRAKEDARTGVYSFERKAATLEPAMVRQFRREPRAWVYFESQPPYYRRVASWWVLSAKRDETRARRLEQLIAHSARNERLPQFTSAPRKTGTT